MRNIVQIVHPQIMIKRMGIQMNTCADTTFAYAYIFGMMCSKWGLFGFAASTKTTETFMLVRLAVFETYRERTLKRKQT